MIVRDDISKPLMRVFQFLGKPKKREAFAWVIIVLLQFLALSKLWFPSISPGNYHEQVALTANQVMDTDTNNMLRMNNHPNEYFEQRRTKAQISQDSFYEDPKIYPKDAGLVSRTWHSNGSPSINSDLQQGSCWCSFDEWCMCTPSMAVDVILTSGSDHLWLIRRQDTGILALMGGMIEVGETSEETVRRELKEEMNIDLNSTPTLFGVYNDPQRDARRHTASVVFIVDLPADVEPTAGDDATDVYRMPMADVQNHDFFIDHKTIINDFMRMKERSLLISSGSNDLPPEPRSGDNEPFKRVICPMDCKV